jgi:Ca-activated chloride channel family protein
MERLGDKGNGYYAYIDTLDEAKRLFSNLTGALQVVARDVKIQVDFNPDVVRSYRLIGYENRDVADVDFRNDTVDGGEIGAGHATTALYELKLWPDKASKIATTYIRYKDPDTFKVTEISADFDTHQTAEGFSNISNSFALASVVTEFAEILRESYWAKGAELQDTLDKAERIRTEFGDNTDVNELVDLITRANRLLENKKQSTEIETPVQDGLEPAEIQYHDSFSAP